MSSTTTPPPALNLELYPATESDFAFFPEPLFAAMGAAVFVSALWPANQTPLGRARTKERWLKELTLHPNMHWVKIVNTLETEADNTTPKTVAIAQWAVFEPGKTYPEVPDLMPEDHWPNQTEKEWALDLWESYVAPRREVLARETEKPVVNLQILCTFPAYRRHGAGGMLVQYGCDLADKLDAVSVVESSGMGELLYKKHGFGVSKRYRLEARREFEERERENIVFMVTGRRGGE